MNLIEGDEFLIELDATGETIHGGDPTPYGDPSLGPKDRASLLALIEGDEFVDELDSTGDNIHGGDPTR